jgi:hypothetical protein
MSVWTLLVFLVAVLAAVGFAMLYIDNKQNRRTA